ncbi:hypothetical protein [Alteromonas macleodii]|uniref:hypothetical protein n=1 Tax=Alteromonas macleodii TaxID=28108 RepID=UPI003140C40A
MEGVINVRLETITLRISDLLPTLDDDGHEQFICELFGNRSIDDLENNEPIYQNSEPAVSRDELHTLAERIIGYTDYSIERAKMVVKNVLNTIPKRLDDLIDYTSEARLSDFKEDARLFLMAHFENNNSLETLEQIELAFRNLPDDMVSMFCNTQMHKSRAISDDMIEGCTERQKVLYRACNYYLNHRLGFHKNSMWLAYCINSNNFGCADGWIHRDGLLCSLTHYGFKDDEAVVNLIMSSMDFLEQYFTKQSEVFEGEESDQSIQYCKDGGMYIDVMLNAMEYLVKRKQLINDTENSEYKQIKDLLMLHKHLFSDIQFLKYMTHLLAFDEYTGFIKEQFELIKKIANKDYGPEGPPEDLYFFLDAWNFIVFDEVVETGIMLSPTFVRSKYHGPSLLQFSSVVLDLMKSNRLDQQLEDMVKGYFENYLFLLVNDNSHTHFLFNEILEVSLKAKDFFENHHVVRVMSLLGHEASQKALKKFY